MSDSVRPHRRHPTRLPRPWDSPGKNTGVGCHFLQCMKWKVKVKLLSRVRPLATHGPQPTRPLCPWDFPGKSTGVGCHCLLRPRQHIKKQRHYFVNKGPSSQGYSFSSSHVWMWQLDYKESWVPKNWCFWTVVLEKILESPLDCKEIQPVHPKEDQSWVFIGRTDVEAETPKLWPPDANSWLIWKDPDAGKDWVQEEKGMTEDEMVGWHHRLNGHEFGWTPGVGDGQGRPGVLWFMGLQRVRHNWATELN